MKLLVDRVMQREDKCLSDALPCLEDSEHPELMGIKFEIVTRRSGIENINIGANPSQEEQEEEYGDDAESVISCVEYGIEKLEEGKRDALGLGTEKGLKKYMSGYLNKVMTTMKEEMDHNEESKKQFEHLKKVGREAIIDFSKMYDPKEHDLFSDPDIDAEKPNCCIFIGKWEGTEVTLWGFKAAFREVKC